jgi:hypothetical protein
MTELKADGKNWAAGIFAAVCGAVLSFGTVFMGIALITGLYDWRTEPTFSRFWDSLYSRLTLHIRRPNYEEFLCLAFGAVAGVWGYNSPKLAPALKTWAVISAPVACLVFVARKIIATASLPQRFADQPDVLQELLWLNVQYTIFYAVLFLVATILTFKLFEKYGDRFKAFLEAEL